MKKRSIAVACLLPALTALHLAPASAAPAAAGAVSAVSGVTLAWADAGRTAIKITWTSPLADKVELTTSYGPELLGTTAAGAADQLVVPVSKFHPTYDPSRKAQIIVTDSAGASASSKEFDQHVPRAKPAGVGISGSSLQGTADVDTTPDATPNDPLDVAVPVPLRYRPNILVDCTRTKYATSSSPSFSIPLPSLAARLWIDTSNEWPAPYVDENYSGFGIDRARISTAAPTSTTYRQAFTLTGTVTQLEAFFTHEQGNCGIGPVVPEPRPVVIQARKDSSSAWGVVGSTSTGAGGRYSFQVTNPGTRQYRSVVPTRKTNDSLDLGVTSGIRTVAATTQVLSAKFLTATVAYGKPATAYLSVLPGSNQRALLQAKNTSGAWAGVTYKTLAGGKGYATITWRRRGVTPFRWYVPASKTSSGLTVGAVFTGSFYLTVR
ncbi:hypothetical protein [Kribbella deserti]|uniref:Uncharacterized protein n=1 Tax=Kribbella deserti TaxID=1926257 RepID=A0ABV6QK60_9ACTN